MNQHKYSLLRSEMRRLEMSNNYLGSLIGLTGKALARRLRDETPWQLEETYAICRELNWPADRIHELFPPAQPLPQKSGEPDNSAEIIASTLEEVARRLRKQPA